MRLISDRCFYWIQSVANLWNIAPAPVAPLLTTVCSWFWPDLSLIFSNTCPCKNTQIVILNLAKRRWSFWRKVDPFDLHFFVTLLVIPIHCIEHRWVLNHSVFLKETEDNKRIEKQTKTRRIKLILGSHTTFVYLAFFFSLPFHFTHIQLPLGALHDLST